MNDFAKDPPDTSKIPKCPHCASQPCIVGMQVSSFGPGALAGIFVCANCSNILSVAPLPVVGVNSPQQHESVIVRPS
jgi:hypothetical protein